MPTDSLQVMWQCLLIALLAKDRKEAETNIAKIHQRGLRMDILVTITKFSVRNSGLGTQVPRTLSQRKYYLKPFFYKIDNRLIPARPQLIFQK